MPSIPVFGRQRQREAEAEAGGSLISKPASSTCEALSKKKKKKEEKEEEEEEKERKEGRKGLSRWRIHVLSDRSLA
jgi:hypothetical protein